MKMKDKLHFTVQFYNFSYLKHEGQLRLLLHVGTRVSKFRGTVNYIYAMYSEKNNHVATSLADVTAILLH